MLDLLTLPVAIILGFLAGLGVGGGSLLILWLTMVVGAEYADARIINLLFFLPAAFITTYFRSNQGTLQIKKVLPAVISGCIAAFLFSHLGRQLNTDLLKKLFGGLLLFTGLRELFYKPKG